MPTVDRRTTALALLADLIAVVVFCTIGRRSHAEGLTVAGIAETSWPFLAGTAVGWLAARAWRQPLSLAPTGVIVWVCTIAVGMVLRKLSGQGVAVSFIIVASLVTALLLFGWRGAATALRHRQIQRR
ncbi:hypothetical protein AU195_05290 [Mycobacterium sp. IS-1496]|uniref:DUF3054 domain-containing protein n=1 Tax=Mycobacterium sp. IS-1496 TaxID=1772284 RepID=UPI0007416D7D|nr:DUF3054 domain-containing protein [Mycobacterium sp. IS-1496]KUI30798.1 hypothetical protein AU195_05290 [Mycobacterium sp. IS-1496]